MDTSWTLSELVAEVTARMEELPPPKNGQVRAVPDERTVRYYGTIGLLDRPVAMRGRTALYGRKHLAQVVAIKRLQQTDKSLAEIQALWPTLDDVTLARMSGVPLPAGAPKPRPARAEFWKAAPAPEPEPQREVRARVGQRELRVEPAVPSTTVELRIELAPNTFLVLTSSPHAFVVDESVSITTADVSALRAAAAQLLAELANRGLTPHPGEDR